MLGFSSPWRRAGRIALVGLLLAAAPALAAEPVRIEATLMRASNDPGGGAGAVDGRVKRLFNFKSYQNYGGGSMSAPVPGNGTINLGHGNRLSIRLAPAGDRIEAGINWSGPSGQVLNTTVVLTRGVAVILGGGKQDGGTMIISVTAR